MISLEEYRDKWLAENVDEFIGFYPREFFCFDNFSAYKVIYNGVKYDTVEHAYQSLKFADTNPLIAQQIRNASSPHGAKQIANKHIDSLPQNWHEIKVDLMENLLRAKLNQYTYVQKKLLETKDYLICEDSPVDDFWGIGKNKDGQNMMGKLWMKLREELIKSQSLATNQDEIITIYTDGACSGNPGPGGWGAIIFENENQIEISGYDPETTNNQMELIAPIKALELIKNPSEITLYSDSAYLINAFAQDWITKWQLNGFKTSNNKDVANKDLWEILINLNNFHKIKWVKVKGHADNEYNNRCDQLATGEIAKNKKDKE